MQVVTMNLLDSPVQLGVLIVIAFLLFGPKKLPELAKSLGESIREFKKSLSGVGEPAPPPAEPMKTDAEPPAKPLTK